MAHAMCSMAREEQRRTRLGGGWKTPGKCTGLAKTAPLGHGKALTSIAKALPCRAQRRLCGAQQG